ncbi:aldose 1-epimerase [Ramlibacter sp. XY19]|uniref:aldose 1-epimerase n=1 Tax=Ramlibacter paludis TaxID=2908000 RepID=UPI0023DAFD82|nr:aldose 1-epimerase [Ramlibacter paludis]MCG2594487.1 aldose 1-epimerase [Ramlibacter paludis]
MIELKAGRLRCELAPELGGSIAGLWLDTLPVLRSTPAAQLTGARQSACYPLVPFSNRIGQATLVWQGTQHPLIRNNGDEPHAIHGVGWQRPWTVLDSDEASVMLAYEHAADASWPFAFDCSHTLRLRPDALELTLALTNQAQQPAPAGLGWHPWFPKRPASRIAFRAGGRWEMGADRLPTVRRISGGLEADCAVLDVDHCYDAWNGQAQLRDEELSIKLSSSLARLVVFTQPARDSIAIEPVSHVNNAVHLYATGATAGELGLQVLQPGESTMAQMTIGVERA